MLEIRALGLEEVSKEVVVGKSANVPSKDKIRGARGDLES